MLNKVAHCVQCILANTRPHQLCWDDQEMGTALLYRKGSQLAGLVNMVDKSISKTVSLHIAVLPISMIIATIGCNCYVLMTCKQVRL